MSFSVIRVIVLHLAPSQYWSIWFQHCGRIDCTRFEHPQTAGESLVGSTCLLLLSGMRGQIQVFCGFWGIGVHWKLSTGQVGWQSLWI